MAGQNVVSFAGTLQAGPPKSSTSGFPTGLVNLGFSLRPALKPASVSVYHVRNLQSPSAFVALHGIGSSEDVTQANFLLCRSDTDMQIRVTTDDGAGGSTVAVIPISGLFVLETPANKFVKLLEAQGSGTVEYFASGNL